MIVLTLIACATSPNVDLEQSVRPPIVDTVEVLPEPLLAIDAPGPPADPLELGAEALAPFKSALRGALMGGMQSGGPTAALEVCQTEAMVITANSQGEMTVGRATNQPRNPANTASGWMTSVLEHYASVPRAAAAPVAVPIDEETWGYAEPIFVGEPCLACHGEPSPEVQAMLSERYPTDQATGYQVGDLRGIFWATGTLEPVIIPSP
jgi:hypothetical protein